MAKILGPKAFNAKVRRTEAADVAREVRTGDAAAIAARKRANAREKAINKASGDTDVLNRRSQENLR